MCDQTVLQNKFLSLRPLLDERQHRLWAAAEARAIGRGGISRVAAATGLSRNTIRAGLRELALPPPSPLPTSGRVRRPGAGRPPANDSNANLIADLQALLEPIGPDQCP